MSREEIWAAVDGYVEETLALEDEALVAAREAAAEAGMPPIAVTPGQGKLLALIARIRGARHILEVGTLAGYSTIWLARALPTDGRVVTLELNGDYAAVARQNIARAGLAERVDLRVGPALELLASLVEAAPVPFDLVFIDADKHNTPEYFTLALELTRPGSVIVADNVVRSGGLADAATEDPAARGGQRLHELLRHERRVSATTIQTVGSKGHDGFTLALVLGAGEAPG